MLLPLVIASALAASMSGSPSAPPPVPGLCTAPVPADPETPGCYRTNDIALSGAPPVLYWHVRRFAERSAATDEAKRHRWSAVTQIHGWTWLYVLGGEDEPIAGGTAHAVIGPLSLPAGPVVAHFAESIFPPGMRTRVHFHPGPEAFYVVEGEQCMDSPTEHRTIAAGDTYIVPSGPHMQAAPTGRRSLVLILAPVGVAPVIPGGDWTPSAFCMSP